MGAIQENEVGYGVIVAAQTLCSALCEALAEQESDDDAHG